MSLSGYEELVNDDETSAMEESTAMREDSTEDITARQEDDLTMASVPAEQSTFHGEESLLDDAELTGSTPRPPATKTFKAQFSHLESPYERMKREMKAEEEGTTVLEDEDSTVVFAQHTARLPDMSMTPRTLLEQRTRELEQSVQRSKDPLMHRVLDKTYRLQATPHKPAYRISPLKGQDRTPKEATAATSAWQDSPMSSPIMAAPTLRSEAFMSPYKSNARLRLAAAANRGPRTPGVSVQTPATGRKTRDVFAEEESSVSADQQKYEIDWDIEDDDEDLDLYAGMSPPKTIQFALPPSKLLQTPGEFYPAMLPLLVLYHG